MRINLSGLGEVEVTEETRKLASVFSKVFRGNEGDIVLENLSEVCCENKTAYAKDGNVNDTIFNEGKREVMLHIRRLLAIYDKTARAGTERKENNA